MTKRCEDVCENIYTIVKELSEREGEGETYEILDQFLEFIRENVETKICRNFA